MKRLIIALGLLIVILSSCTTSGPESLVKIEYISPKNGQTSVSLKPSFVWSVKNADINSMTFDLYLSQDSESVKSGQDDSLVASAIEGSSYSLKNELSPGQYFWKVVAHGGRGNTVEGPVWNFTTVSNEASGDNVLNPKILNTIFTEGGPFYGAFMLNKSAVVALTQDELDIYNIDDDGNLEKISSFSKEGYTFNKMVIEGNFAYIFGYDNDSNHCFCVVDLSDVSSPSLVSKITLNPIYDPKEIEVENSYVYMNAGEEITIINVENPRDPEIVGKFKPEDLKISTDFFENMKVYENKLYLRSNPYDVLGGILVFDVTNPASPKYVEKILSDQDVYHFDLNQDYLFVISYDTFIIYDRKDYTKLSEINLEDLGVNLEDSSIKEIKSYGDHVFLMAYNNLQSNCEIEIVRVDISDLSSLHLDGEIALPIYNCLNADFSCSENFILVSAGYNGLIVLSDSDDLRIKNVFKDKGNIITSEVYGDALIASDDANGLLIFNLKSSPASPKILGQLPESNIEKMVIKDHTIYSVTEWNFLTIDVKDLSKPRLMGSMNSTTGYNTDLVVKDKYAYIADGESGLLIVDVTFPEFPTTVDKIPLGKVVGLALEGTSLYASVQDEDEIVELDITNPSNPKVTRRKFLPSSPGKLIVTGDKIYVATSGMVSAEVMSINRKNFKENNVLKACVNGLRIFGDHLYILGDTIYVVDTSNDKLIQTIDTGVSNINDIIFYGDYAYISTSSKGILVVQNDFESWR